MFLENNKQPKSQTVPHLGSTHSVVKFQFWCMLLLLKLWAAATGLQDCGRSFRSKFLALSFDFFTQLHEVPMSIASSPLSSDGSFIIVPQKLGNFWLFDEDMVENELPILKQIQHKPISFTSCTLRQTAAQGTGNKLGQVLLQGHTTCTWHLVNVLLSNKPCTRLMASHSIIPHPTVFVMLVWSEILTT